MPKDNESMSQETPQPAERLLDKKMSRRDALRFGATAGAATLSAAAGLVSRPHGTSAEEAASVLANLDAGDVLEQDSRVEHMGSVSVWADPEFVATRGFEMGLNTVDYTEAQAEDQAKLTIAKLFSYMHHNRRAVESGNWENTLATGGTPEPWELSDFGKKLGQFSGDSEKSAIPVWHNREGAVFGDEPELGTFDCTLGADIVFSGAPLANDVKQNNGVQTYGYAAELFTPEPTEKNPNPIQNKLRLRIYAPVEGYSGGNGFTPDQHRNAALNYAASQMLQVFGLTHGKRDTWFQYKDSGGYNNKLFGPPYEILPGIPSLITGKPEGDAYWSYPSPFIFHGKDVTPLAES